MRSLIAHSGPLAAGLIALLLACSPRTAGAAPLDLYVSPDGRDTWSGRRDTPASDGRDGPFATLEKARDTLRRLRRAGTAPRGGVTIWLKGGAYRRATTFVLTDQDSGALDAPVVYRAVEGEAPRLTGSDEVKGWKLVTDPAVLNRVAVHALGHVFQADLKAQGIPGIALGAQTTASTPARVAGLEVYCQDRPMPLSHWPNTGWAKIAGTPAGQNGDRFTYEGDRPALWKDVDSLWLSGYWTWDWAHSYVKAGSVDPKKREIVTLPPHGVYGYTAGKRWQALNALEEIDEPGEWCYDRKAGVLYFWPPAALEDIKVTVARLEEPLVALRGASNVVLRGLMLEQSLGAGVEVVGGSDNLVAGCTLRNLGTWGASIDNGSGGERNGLRSCDLYNLGAGGIMLIGGSRKTLTPGRDFAENCDIHDFARWDRTYKPAVAIDGVGNRIANNRIHDAPHEAIAISGNDNLVEYNDVSRVCLETGDAGAFYMGRDWTQRGNIVRYNYFHDLRAGSIAGEKGFTEVMAVYLDDLMSGTVVFGNLFVRAGRAVLLGGGRDNVVENNVFVDCQPAVHVDSRGTGWGSKWVTGEDPTVLDRLKAANYTQPPYSTRYPELANILKDEPGQPRGNRILRNVCAGGKWLDLLDGLTDKTIAIRDNLVAADPGLVDAKAGDYALAKTSAAWKLGFQRIPLERIGVKQDAYREGVQREP